MTYPPGSPGYPPAQQPTAQFSAPTQQFGKVERRRPAAAEGPSELPVYLTAAVAALGLAVYLSSFGPLFTAGADFFTPTLLDLGVVASLLAALIAGVALLPKQKAAPALVAALSVLGFLLVIAIVLTAPDGVSIDWGLYLIIAFTRAAGHRRGGGAAVRCRGDHPARAAAQVRAAVRPVRRPGGVLRTASSRRPALSRAAAAAAASRLSVAVRRLSGRSPSTGGFSAGPQGGPPTPPTGFPTYGQPPSKSAPTDPGAGTQSAVFLAVRPRAVVV